MLREPVTVCPAGPPVVRAAVRAEPIPTWTEPQVVERDGGRTRFIAGSLRGEFEGDALRWGTGRFAETIVDAWRDAQGWVFRTDDGLTARADTFLGPLRAVAPVTPERRPVERPPLDRPEFDRVRWAAFVRYRLWLVARLHVRRPDGSALGVLHPRRPDDPWEVWRVDGATGCVTHAPYRLPGRASRDCRRSGEVGIMGWGTTLAVVGVTGTEARLHALEDDLRLTDLGPLPWSSPYADDLCGSDISERLVPSDDGRHALFGHCDGRDRWCTFDRASARWRPLDGVPAEVTLLRLHGPRAVYYDPGRERLRVGDIVRAAFDDLGETPVMPTAPMLFGDGTLTWLPDGSLTARGIAAPRVLHGTDDTPPADPGDVRARFTWIARGAVAPFRRVRQPQRASVFMVDGSIGYAYRAVPSPPARRFDLLRTRDGGAHWEVIDIRAGATASVDAWIGFLPPACAGPFCVAEHRVLWPTGAPETPGEDVLDASAAPSSSSDDAEPSWRTAWLCNDPVEVVEALNAARATLAACVDGSSPIRSIALTLDARGRFVTDARDTGLAGLPRACVAAIARALPSATPSVSCLVPAWILPNRVTFVEPDELRNSRLVF